MKKFFVVCAVCLAAQGAFANDITRTIELPDDYVESQLIWSGTPKPGFIIRWSTEVHEGLIEICGAVQFPSNASVSQSRAILRKTKAVYEEKVVLRNMTFFKKVKNGSKADWSEANCASTGVKAPNGRYSISVGWDAGRAKF